MHESSVTDRPVALVTGAARGQGLAIVRRLIDKGYDVVACDVLEDELTAALAGLPLEQVLARPLDVTSEEDWSAAVRATESRFGRLDGLVNNAGVLYRASIDDDDPADFERTWRVNCLGPYLGIRACLPLLRRSDRASIVNTSSNAGLRPYPNHIGYATSKWAVRGLSQSTAVELAPQGIRVNAIFPGPIATPMHDEQTTERLSRATLIGRAGQAEEVASTVAFLLSEESSFTIGAEILIDGGQMLKVQT